jgi:hypothetical protein
MKLKIGLYVLQIRARKKPQNAQKAQKKLPVLIALDFLLCVLRFLW